MLRSAVVPLCLVLAAIPAARAAAALPQQQVERIFAQWSQATPGTYRSAEADAVYKSSGRKRPAGRARAQRRDLAADRVWDMRYERQQ
jgi:hypothetical protein